MQAPLLPRHTPEANADSSDGKNLFLSIPDGSRGKYRWAQFDDYMHKARRNFEWKEPCRLSLTARCSNPQHDGTWGFGFWNDPFSTSLGIRGSVKRLPALPNCAWFFYASEQNYLSFHDHLPAQGFLAATFSSPRIPPAILAFAIPSFPILLWRKFTRIARHALRTLIRQDAVLIDIDVTTWHNYQIDWQQNRVSFLVDSKVIIETSVAPHGRQGLVIWVDNQFAAFPPDGNLTFGTLASSKSTTLEIKDLMIN